MNKKHTDLAKAPHAGVLTFVSAGADTKIPAGTTLDAPSDASTVKATPGA